jgi:predicted phosphodiesterase
MKIAALSDFHIGSSRRGDCFRHSAADFHDYLKMLEESHDQIVLLGDIFQAEHGPSLSKAGKRRELQRAHNFMPDLWLRMQGPQYRYLHGNHDGIASAGGRIPETLRIDEDGFSIFFVHGHQYDPLLRRAYPLAQASTWFSGRLRALRLHVVADWLEHQDIQIKNEAFRGEKGPYVGAARLLLLEHQVDAVLMGHTHIPQRMDLAEGIFANTGSCSMGQRTHVSIDTLERSVILHQLASSAERQPVGRSVKNRSRSRTRTGSRGASM